ncbi:hypothetical protein IIB34_05725, partial [PVC group bacterium]|nr:hypothetical protein [PVC group bacterium]
DPEEEKDLYPGTPGAKVLVEMQEELLDSNAHTELDAPVEDDFSHIIDSVPGAQGAAIENRILDFAAALFVNTSGSSVEEKEITILSMEKVKIQKSPTGPISTVLLVKVSFQDKSAYIKAELNEDESDIAKIESLEASDNLVGAVKARNVLASKLDIENKEDITIIETLSTVNHVRDKPKGSSLSQTRIKTQEVALQVDDEVYVIQTTYIEIVKASSDEKTTTFDRSPETLTSAPYTRIAKEQSQSIITTSISKQQAQSVVTAREKSKKIQKVVPVVSPSPPTPVQQGNGVWALFRLVLPNHPVKRLALLHQIEDNTPPAQTSADSSDDKNEGMSKVEELEKRIDALALDERSRALKDKEDMKRSSLKEKNALKSHGVKQETQKKTKEKQMGKKGSR